MNTNTTIKEHLVYKIFGLKVPDLLLLLIHTFSVLSLQLKKLR